MIRSGIVLVLLASTQVYAQPGPAPAPAGPQDPYAVPPGQDPVLNEQIAEQLVARAQDLVEARIYVDAKQLAVEALVKSPKGAAADHAHYIIKIVNQQLGIKEDQPEPQITPPVDVTPIEDPTKKIDKPAEPVLPPADGVVHDGKLAANVHGAIYGGLIGATIGSLFSSKHPAAGAIPVGVVGGLLTGLYVPRLFQRWNWDEAQVRTVGAGSVWGGVLGGMITDAAMGANGGTVTAQGVLIGASVGATLGMLGGASIATDHKLTRGDVALVDTLAGIGTVGGLTLGMLMQPAQAEAYAVNAFIGATGGVIAGYIAGPQTNTTPRRMLRVAGVAAAGGALPFLLYAGIHNPNKTSDERITGALSTVGLVGGAWLGFYLTRNFEVGLDVQEGHKKLDDAPPSLVGRNSDGRWGFGGVALQPLSPALAPQQGLTLTLVGASFE